MRRRLRLFGTLAVIALITVGCSNPPGESGTGSSDGSSDDGSSTAASRNEAMQFAQCMRDHGVREFPDPDASGALTIETVANGTSIDTDSPAFQQAVRACKDLEPSGFTGFKRSPEQQQAALRFARCMRDNGVQDFPDPGPDDPLVDTNRIPSANRPGGMDILNAAMEPCGHYAGEAGVTGP